MMVFIDVFAFAEVATEPAQAVIDTGGKTDGGGTTAGPDDGTVDPVAPTGSDPKVDGTVLAPAPVCLDGNFKGTLMLFGISGIKVMPQGPDVAAAQVEVTGVSAEFIPVGVAKKTIEFPITVRFSLPRNAVEDFDARRLDFGKNMIRFAQEGMAMKRSLEFSENDGNSGGFYLKYQGRKYFKGYPGNPEDTPCEIEIKKGAELSPEGKLRPPGFSGIH